MPDCLRDLFKQTSSEQSDCFVSSYFQNSTETYKSVLDISGLKLPPPPVRIEDRRQCFCGSLLMKEFRSFRVTPVSINKAL